MEMEALSEQITQLRIGVGKMDTKLDGLLLLDTKLDAVSKVADSAQDSTTSAHKRLDAMVITQRWGIGLSLTVLALMVTIASLAFSLWHK